MLEDLLWEIGGMLPLASVSDQFLLWLVRLQGWILPGSVLPPSLHPLIEMALIHSQKVLPFGILVSVQWIAPAAALVSEVRMMVVAGIYSDGVGAHLVDICGSVVLAPVVAGYFDWWML